MKSDSGRTPKKLYRNSLSIFSRIKNTKDEDKKKELNQLLETLRNKLPEGFKIGAALGEGDCFFDSLAQGLNELKDKGRITSSKRFSVKSLRGSCKRCVQRANQSEGGLWLDNALKRKGGKLCEYIPGIGFTVNDIENAIWEEVEGKIICEKYSIKIKVVELRDEGIDGLHVTKRKIGSGTNIVYIANYRNHFVPLLSSLKKDIKENLEFSRDKVSSDLVGLNLNDISQRHSKKTFTQLKNAENFQQEQSGHSRSPGKKNDKTSEVQ